MGHDPSGRSGRSTTHHEGGNMDTAKTTDIEIRLVGTEGLELRACTRDAPSKLGDSAAVVNSTAADLRGSREVIVPAAFTASITDNSDIRALVSHDADKLLGRTSNRTLNVVEDDQGLRVEIDVPDTSYGRDLMALV